MDKEEMRRAAESFPTPFYVYDEDKFKNRLISLKKSLDSESIGLTYSMKANPFMVNSAVQLVERIEVCSYGEFNICKALMIPASKILLSGVLKEEKQTEDMVHYGKANTLYTAESPSQMKFLNEAAQKENIRIPVILRLTSGNQFGMDEDTLLRCILNRAMYPNIQIIGLHFFSGTKKKDLKRTQRELEKLDTFIRKILIKTGLQIKMLEYGTGFSVPYFEGENETVTPAFLNKFNDLVRSMNYRGKITVEMGRAIAYDCGYYATTICDKKKTDDKTYCITDGGIHQLHYDGQLRGIYRPYTELLRKNAESVKAEEHAVICGSLCTTNDILIADYKEKADVGDVLVFKNTGAYSINEGMSTFLSHELPLVLIYKDKQFISLRERIETWKLNLPAS